MLYANKPGKIKIPSNVFKCKDGSYIEETSVCDGNIDCIDMKQMKFNVIVMI